MERVYKEFDESSRIDDAEASRELIAQGLIEIEPHQENVNEWRKAVMKSNRALAEKGEVDIGLFNQMLTYLQEYRAKEDAATAIADAGAATKADSSE